MTELALCEALVHRRSEEIIEDVGEEEVDGEDAAPDARDPVDAPPVVGQDVNRQDQQHHRDKDGEVLKE